MSCCFKDKDPEKSWRSQILRFYSVTRKTVLQSVSAVAGLFFFFESTGGKKRTRNKISEQPALSQGGVFQRSQCPFTHQFTLISTLHSCLCTRSFAQKPCHKSTHSLNPASRKKKKPLSYEHSIATKAAVEAFFPMHLFVPLDTVCFFPPQV